MRKNFIVAFILICITFCTNIYAKVPYEPTNDFFVNDFANILSNSTEQQIQNISVNTQNATSAQIVVVTVPDLDGRDIEGYANELFNDWKIGDSEKDNGILLIISSGDRKVRIEVGYGLEGAINDAKAGRILDDVAIPYMKDNDYDTAVVGVVTQIQGIIYNEYGIEGGFDNYQNEEKLEVISAILVIGVTIFFIFLRIFLASKGIFIFGGFGGRGGFGGGSFGGGGFSGGGGSSGGGRSLKRFLKSKILKYRICLIFQYFFNFFYLFSP